jgi:cytochrome c oxidase subunit 2
LKYFKGGARGTHEKDAFGKVMAPMAATLPDDAAIANVTAYVATLPDTPASHTVNGNPGDGQRLFVSTCGVCHGPEGQGKPSTNAPRLAGMSDWYLVTQLRNFRQGIRGHHPDDLYGPQMSLMAATLADDQAVHDLVAYVNKLR